MFDGMGKVQFKEIVTKDSTGYTRKEIVSYVDVTTTVKEMMDNVKKAVLVCDTYHEAEPLEEWKSNQSERYEKMANSKRISLDYSELYIMFTSGKMIRIDVSEWGSLAKGDYSNYFQ